MRVVFGVAAAAALAMSASGAGVAGSAGARAEVDPRVWADTAEGRPAHFLVVLRRGVDSGTVADARGAAGLVESLRRAAAQTQPSVLAHLRRLGATARPYWIVNAIAVRGTRSAVDAMAARPDVAAVEPDRRFRGIPRGTVVTSRARPAGVEWNVERIGAPAVWASGVTGQGTVYASADTGVVWDHPALKSQYRGWDGSAATHDYNWWDAIHEDLTGNGANPCGFSVRAPCDDNSHGTHVMGTAVGDDRAGNQIGVAPGSRWIGCRNMEEGFGRPSTYIECLQFFLAPTDLNGSNPDPSRRPHAVGNSYSCPPEEGCSVGSLQTAVDTMRSAGIFMAVAAGNSGPSCGSVTDPPAVYDSSVTVGSVDASDVIARSSSRGPVAADGSQRPKPDLVAPGVAVRSALLQGYGVRSGTSMAAPHVGAAALLLWSGRPDLRGRVDATESLLARTAVPLTTDATCGGDPSGRPNNTYGWGRLDVLAAYRSGPTSAALAVGDVRVRESRSAAARFVIRLLRPATGALRVRARTADGTAKARADYVPVARTLTFAPGQTQKTILVRVVHDAHAEPPETFELLVDADGRATRARATILDAGDRESPVVSRLRARPAPAGGVAVTFTLSEPARIALTLESDRRRVARFVIAGRKGGNAVLLRTNLAPGSYRATAAPRDRAGNAGRPAHTAFTVR